MFQKRLDDKHLTVEITPAAKNFVIDCGYDPNFGARPLRRFIQSRIETLVAKAIISENPSTGDKIKVDYNGCELFTSINKQ